MCDNKFHLDSVLEMFEEEETYGIAMISGDEALFYQVATFGATVDYRKIAEEDVRLMNKFKKGGQSALRFSRIRENNYHTFVTKISTRMESVFVSDQKCIVKSIVLAGPAGMKNAVHENLSPLLKSKITKIVNVAEITPATVREVYLENPEAFVDPTDGKELQRLQHMIEMADDRLMFGQDEIIEALQQNLVAEIFTDGDFVIDEAVLKACKMKVLRRMPNGIKLMGVRWF